MRSILVLLGLSFWRGASAEPIQDKRFIVGYLRHDGFLVPFANYDNEVWSNPWGQESERSPRTLEDIPQEWIGNLKAMPAVWVHFPVRGSKHVLRVGPPARFKGYDEEKWGLKVSTPTQQFPEHWYPQPKLGLATTGDQEILGFTRVEGNETDSKRILRYLGPLFSRFEAQIRGFIIGPIMAKSKLRLERGRLKGFRLFHVHASREFKHAPADDCGVFSVLDGWVIEKVDGQMALLEEVFEGRGEDLFRATDCDHKEVRNVDPIGWLKPKNTFYIVAQEGGWESQEYAVLQLDLDKDVLRKVISVDSQ